MFRLVRFTHYSTGTHLTARIAILDIETAPSLGFVWGKYDQNVIDFEKNWYILSYGFKWLGDDEIIIRALPDYPGYKKDSSNDRALMVDLWKVYDEADIIVAHNGDNFDVKKSNARFITHDMPPPSTYKTVDTLKIARKHFKFDSNKLNDLAQYLELGSKMKHTGWALWKGCMNGDPESWATMKAYNVQDVALLEEVYLKLRPWAASHPNLNLYSDHEGCTHCGSLNVQRRGFNYAKVQVRQRFQCQECYGWFSGKVIKKKEIP